MTSGNGTGAIMAAVPPPPPPLALPPLELPAALLPALLVVVPAAAGVLKLPDVPLGVALPLPPDPPSTGVSS